MIYASDGWYSIVWAWRWWQNTLSDGGVQNGMWEHDEFIGPIKPSLVWWSAFIWSMLSGYVIIANTLTAFVALKRLKLAMLSILRVVPSYNLLPRTAPHSIANGTTAPPRKSCCYCRNYWNISAWNPGLYQLFSTPLMVQLLTCSSNARAVENRGLGNLWWGGRDLLSNS